VRARPATTLGAAGSAALAIGLALAPAASASSGAPAPLLASLGLPSLQDIIDAIAKGFFGALAAALVPDFLKHGTVATIQHLVALPDPTQWSHVGQLQGEMVYLGAMLLPVALAVGTVRYWMLGFSGAAHPASALGRCAGATGVLAAYRWIVEQAVAAANTLTHAILGLPAVGGGLQRIIAVLFGGALLTGVGGVFGAFLVIVGVIFAAGLFAIQVLLTVVLALLIVGGPPLIALSAIPELSHLARAWGHALLTVTLVPLGWTILFATAGALSLDATGFTGGAGGLPGHVAAAFAGLITFVLAVRLPLMLLGEVGHLFGGAAARRGRSAPTPKTTLPGTERVRAAHARLRSVALEGVPALGRSVGLAAAALGAPAGGPLGAARRRLLGFSRGRPARSASSAAAAGALLGATAAHPARAARVAHRVRERFSRAGMILAAAPGSAREAMSKGSRVRRASPPRPDQGAKASTSTGGRRATVVGAWAKGAARGARAPTAGAVPTRAGPRAAAPRKLAPEQIDRAAAGSGAPREASSSGHPGRALAGKARSEVDRAVASAGARARPAARDAPRPDKCVKPQPPPQGPKPPPPPRKATRAPRRPRPRRKP
jgi:hypothetical protein